MNQLVRRACFFASPMLALAAGCSSTHPLQATPAHAKRECLSWNSLDAGVKRQFGLVSCSPLNPENWDTEQIVGPTECTTGAARLAGKRESDDTLDSFAELSMPGSHEPPLVLRPEPRVTQKMAGGGAAPAIACDTELLRFYLGNPFLGYLVAYRADGKELWRVSLPEFRTIIGRTLEDNSPRGMLKVLDAEGGILTKVVPMDRYVGIAYRVRGRYYESIVHRSGIPVAVLGPWDGLLVRASSNRWVFDAGGEAAHGSWKLPTEELQLQLLAKTPDLVLDHFVAWILPQPSDNQLTWRKCDGDNRFVRLDLGKKFDSRADEIARKIHDGLGPDWAGALFQSDAVSSVAIRGRLDSLVWKAKVREAFLNAGVDVDLVNYAREHGLLEEILLR